MQNTPDTDPPMDEATVTKLRGLTAPPLTPGFRDRLREQIEDETTRDAVPQPAVFPSRRRLTLPAWLSTAAVLAVIAGAWGWMAGGGGGLECGHGGLGGSRARGSKRWAVPPHGLRR